mmetsp:Transcript_37850/g.62786  ORF Transcript_37850/g.62786 Transcript_37850/m.62786 type:complete len:555 (-) Transcript_37850:75-1739(-)
MSNQYRGTRLETMEALDSVIREVAGNAETWASLSHAEKRNLLYEIRDNGDKYAPEFAEASNRLRHYEDFPHLQPAGWVMGPCGMFCIGVMIATYESLVRNGTPPKLEIRIRPDGQKIVSAYPISTLENVAAAGNIGEMWLHKSSTGEQGACLQQKGCTGLLGAGNYDFPTELINKMFSDNHVAIYKANPVNAAVVDVLSKILAPLIDRKFLAIIKGSAAEGAFITQHPLIDDLLIVGAESTYNRIVWGPPDQQAANKKAGKKLCTKPFEAELGCVNPFIIVPGKWTSAEIKHHAAQIIGSKSMNSGHICASPGVIVVDAHWPQRKEFQDALREAWKSVKPVPLFYPGVAERCQKLKRSIKVFDEVEGGDKSEERIFVPNAPDDCILFKEETFGSVLTEKGLEGCNGDPTTFLTEAVKWCNDSLWGTLTCTILIDPVTEKAIGRPALEGAIAALRYGAVGVNQWGLLIFGLPLAWGAFPGSTPEDIQSGTAPVMNNYFLLDKVEKSVLYSPFMSPGHPKLLSTGDLPVFRSLTYFGLRQTWTRLFSLLRAFVLGF